MVRSDVSARGNDCECSSSTALRGLGCGAYIAVVELMDPIRDFLSSAFFLDKPIDDPKARTAKAVGMGLSILWLVMLVFHLIAYRKFSLFLLGLMTLAAWVLLWRIGFRMAGSYFRWKL